MKTKIEFFRRAKNNYTILALPKVAQFLVDEFDFALRSIGCHTVSLNAHLLCLHLLVKN